jgi:hypothetical protein
MSEIQRPSPAKLISDWATFSMTPILLPRSQMSRKDFPLGRIKTINYWILALPFKVPAHSQQTHCCVQYERLNAIGHCFANVPVKSSGGGA